MRKHADGSSVRTVQGHSLQGGPAHSTPPLTCRKRRAGVAADGSGGAVVAALQGRTELPEGVGLRHGQGRVAGAGWRDGGNDVTLLGRSPPILTRLGRHVL